jgi:hypothetical protein
VNSNQGVEFCGKGKDYAYPTKAVELSCLRNMSTLSFEMKQRFAENIDCTFFAAKVELFPDTSSFDEFGNSFSATQIFKQYFFGILCSHSSFRHDLI